jgi:hypothetical protein
MIVQRALLRLWVFLPTFQAQQTKFYISGYVVLVLEAGLIKLLSTIPPVGTLSVDESLRLILLPFKCARGNHEIMLWV